MKKIKKVFYFKLKKQTQILPLNIKQTKTEKANKLKNNKMKMKKIKLMKIKKFRKCSNSIRKDRDF